MAKNGKYLLIIVGVILIMANMQGTEKKEEKLEIVQVALPPITLGVNQIIGMKVSEPIIDGKETIYFPQSLFAIQSDYNCIACSTGDKCCVLQGTSGSFCNAWCNEREDEREDEGEIIYTCPSGTVDVGNNLCCPSSNPYFCSQNNLCYQEANCGVGTLGEVQCRQDNSMTCTDGDCKITEIGAALFRKEIGHSTTSCNSCIGNIEEQSGSTCLCDVYAWDASNLRNELNQQFDAIGKMCNSCSGYLCVRNNRCQLGEIRCAGENTFFDCKTIKPTYFASSFNDYPTTLQSCPAGNICRNNACTPDFSGVCNNVKDGVLNAITAWANSPSETAKSQILTRITDWAGKC